MNTKEDKNLMQENNAEEMNKQDKNKSANEKNLDSVINEIEEQVEGATNKEGKTSLKNYGHDPKGPGIAPIL